jgi:hypothetical protein
LTAGSIAIRSLDNVEKANTLVGGGNVTGAWGRAPCGSNLIRNNRVGRGVSLYYRAIKVINGHAITFSPYYSYNNAVVDNKISDVLWANYQYCYLSGNDGTTKFYKVTRITEASLDRIFDKFLDDGKSTSSPRNLRIISN